MEHHTIPIKSHLDERLSPDDDCRNNNQIAAILSSKELPSWAMRQTAPVLPNSHIIAECQGCIKGHGTAHTCDMKDDDPQRFSSNPPSVVPHPPRQTFVPQRVMNPYPGSEDLYPPSYRRPAAPPRRHDQHPYYVHHGYERGYYEDYDDDDYGQYGVDALDGRYVHNAFAPYQGHRHGYEAIDPPAFLRSRRIDDPYLHHPAPIPPPQLQHPSRHPIGRYPHASPEKQPLEWQSRSLQNCSQPLQVYPESFVDDRNLKNDWLQIEVDQRLVTSQPTPQSNLSRLRETSFSMCPIVVPEDGRKDRVDQPMENSPLSQQRRYFNDTHLQENTGGMASFESSMSHVPVEPVSHFHTEPVSQVSVEPASHVLVEPVSLKETKISFTEKFTCETTFPKTDSRIWEHTSQDASNKDYYSSNRTNVPAVSEVSPGPISLIEGFQTDRNWKQEVVSNSTPANENKNKTESSATAKSDRSIQNGDDGKQEALPSFSRKSPLAFTIDISPSDGLTAPKLPPNLARRAAKFPRKPAPKEQRKAEASTSLPSTPVIGQRKKYSSDFRSKQDSSANRDRPTGKQSNHHPTIFIDDDYNEDEDDFDGILRSDRLKQLPKQIPRTRQDKTESTALPAKQDTYKFPGPALRTTTLSWTPNKSRIKGQQEDTSLESRIAKTGKEVFEKENFGLTSARFSSANRQLNDTKQSKYNVSRRSPCLTDDYSSDEFSEAETYTIKAAGSNNEAAAARQKIDMLFRVGIDDGDDVEEKDDDKHSSKSYDVKSPAYVTQLTTNEVKYNDESSSLDNSENVDDGPEKKEKVGSKAKETNTSALPTDSDDVICLTYEPTRVVSKSRSNAANDSITSGQVPSQLRSSSSSLNKRMLPRPPERVEVAANNASPAAESESNSNHQGDPDTGFFEVLSSEAPRTRKPEDQRKTTPETSFTEGTFEVLADTPRLRNLDTTFEIKTSEDSEPETNEPWPAWSKSGTKHPSKTRETRQTQNDLSFSSDKSSGIRDRTTLTSTPDRRPPLQGGSSKSRFPARFDESSSTDGETPRSGEVSAKSWWLKTALGRSEKQTRQPSGNDSVFHPTSGRSEGRRLPESPPKPVYDTKSETTTRARFSFGSRGTKKDTGVETMLGVVTSAHGTTSQTSTPRLTPRFGSIGGRQKTMDNPLESRPPLSGSYSRPVLSKTMSDIPGTPSTSRPAQVRQRSLSRPPLTREEPRSASRPPLSRSDQSRRSLKLPKTATPDSGEGQTLSRTDRFRFSLRGRASGETPKPEKSTADDTSARTKRSRSVTSNIRSKNPDPENPKLQAYHERMKYDPRKSIQEARKGQGNSRLSAGSRSDDTEDGSSYEELQSQRMGRRIGSSSSEHQQQSEAYRHQSSPKSGILPRPARPGRSSDEGLTHNASSDVDGSTRLKTDARETSTMSSIQNLSEDIKNMLQQFSRKIRGRSPATVSTKLTKPPSNKPADNPELKELLNTLVEVKQVLESKLQP